MKHVLTPSETWMIEVLYGTIQAIMDGKVSAIGLCSADSRDGTPSFVYMDQTDTEALLPAIGRLVGLYHTRSNGLADRVNAPAHNRSYETH